MIGWRFHMWLIVLTTPWTTSSVIVNSRDDFELTIVHFNDFHARFEETSLNSMKCDPKAGQCIGGFPRLYTAIKNIKTQTPDALVLNAGDDFQGTLWYNTLRWNVTQHFMNMLPLDASTLGNHEFDDGIKGVVPYLQHRRTPFVACNIDDSLEPTIQGLYKKSIVVERNGRKIGIVGVISEITNEMATTEKLKFLSEVESVKSEALKLKNQGVDIIIVLSHCGLENDKKIAKNGGPNIDVIVGGHSHSLLYNGNPPNGVAEDTYPTIVEQATGSKVLIVQAASYSKYLGNITIKFNKGKMVSWIPTNPIYLDGSVKQDQKILELMEPYKSIVDRIGKRQVGTSNVLLDKTNCVYGECSIGNFVNDAFVRYFVNKAEDGYWTYAAVSVMNQGGVRTNINKGPVTYEDLAIAFPFSNNICTFEIEGKYILQSLEHAVEDIVGNSTYRMLQVSGLHIVYNITKPVNQRVDSVSILCAKCDIPRYYPLEMDTVYRISTLSFIANGGDGFVALAKNKKNMRVWETDIDIIEKHFEKYSPVDAKEDNRITVLQ